MMKIGDKIVFRRPWYTFTSSGDDDYISKFTYATLIWRDDKSCVVEDMQGYRHLRDANHEIMTIDEYVAYKAQYEAEYDEPEMWISE